MDLTEEGPPLGTLLEYVIAAKTILKRKRLKAPIQIRKKSRPNPPILEEPAAYVMCTGGSRLSHYR